MYGYFMASWRDNLRKLPPSFCRPSNVFFPYSGLFHGRYPSNYSRTNNFEKINSPLLPILHHLVSQKIGKCGPSCRSSLVRSQMLGFKTTKHRSVPKESAQFLLKRICKQNTADKGQKKRGSTCDRRAHMTLLCQHQYRYVSAYCKASSSKQSKS